MTADDMPAGGSQDEGRAQVLMVDDEPLNLMVLNEMLRSDHDVFAVTSGEEALSFCRTKLPDLVLLDVTMPGLNGYEVCRRLRQDALTQSIPVIFVTAHDDPVEEERGLEAGAVDFITKSTGRNVIRARIKTHLTLKRQSDLLRSLALVDGLTGVANRRHFDERMAAEWRRGARSGMPLSVILIDIDYFKRFNDRYGHLAGDDCLRRVAATLKGAFARSHDLVARYGGEELACVLPDTAFEGAEAKAAELERAVRSLAIPHEGSELEARIVTISGGVATTIPDKDRTASELLLFADQMLYQAKQAGRSQIKAVQL